MVFNGIKIHSKHLLVKGMLSLVLDNQPAFRICEGKSQTGSWQETKTKTKQQNLIKG